MISTLYFEIMHSITDEGFEVLEVFDDLQVDSIQSDIWLIDTLWNYFAYYAN